MERTRLAPEIPRRRSDGDQTHAAILDTAMRIASIEGLGSLSIGRLAQELGVSKSGVFAHFRSKQRLQEETIGAARSVFEREVLRPGLAEPDGLRRLEALCESYLSYLERGVFPGGCFFAQVLAEFDAREGPIHDAVQAGQQQWLAALEAEARTAQRQNEMHSDVDAAQLAFELSAALEMANYLSMLNRDRSLVQFGRTAVQAALGRAARTSAS